MNQNYHYDQKIDYSRQAVYPMCCCCYGITEKGFYRFINFFDIIFAVIILVSNATTFNTNKVPNSINISIYAVWFVLAVSSFVWYCSSKSNYGTLVHKFYAVIRMGISIINLCLVAMFIVTLIVDLNKTDVVEDRTKIVWLLITQCLINLPIGLVSLNWSCLLSRVVNNRGIMNTYENDS